MWRNPEFHPEGEAKGRRVSMDTHLTVYRISKVEPKFFAFATLVFEPEIVWFFTDV